MTLATFALILTGVLLNAGAQLLLKAGVTPLGELSVGLHNLLPTTIRVLTQWPILAGQPQANFSPFAQESIRAWIMEQTKK